MWFSLSIILNILTGYPLNQPVTSTHGAAFLSKDNSPFHGQWLENDRGQAVVSLRPRFLKPRKSHWRCVARDSNDSSDLIQELHSRVPWSFSSFAIASILSGDWNRPRLAVATRWILWCPDYLNDIGDIVIPNISVIGFRCWGSSTRFGSRNITRSQKPEQWSLEKTEPQPWSFFCKSCCKMQLWDAGSVGSKPAIFLHRTVCCDFMETKRFEFEHRHKSQTSSRSWSVFGSESYRKVFCGKMVFDGFCPFSCEASLVTVLWCRRDQQSSVWICLGPRRPRTLS